MSITSVIKSIQDIMRKDAGVDGDAQRITQLGWMLFLKIFDDREKEYEALDPDYRSVIPEQYRWRNWAEDPEGITGEALHDFITQLFRALRNLEFSSTDDPRGFATFDALLDAYETQIAYLLDRYITTIAAYERRWMRINPSPLLAGTLADCLPRGRDVGEAGPVYNSVGCVGAELANACDSLLAIKRVVFDEGRLTMEELLAALDADFVGHEPMRQYLLHRVPKWGNGDPEADALGKRIADHYCRTVHGYTNARGGRCQAALFTLTAQFTFGALTPALPDGRRSREALAPGVGAHPGRDLNGATGLIESVTGLDFCETPNGAVLDLTLHPSAVRGEEGLQAFVDLIQTFLSEGGYALQVNVIDAETLREAQRNPEQYATLQIRVTGWSVFFVTLSRFEQDQFIARLAHRMN